SRGPEQRVEFARADRDRHVLYRPDLTVPLGDMLHLHFRQPDRRGRHHGAIPYRGRPLRADATTGTRRSPMAARLSSTELGGNQASSVVAKTGPTNEAPIRAEFRKPMTSPEARCAIAATARGNTGAPLRPCTKRMGTKGQTLVASESAARQSEELPRSHGTARRSPRASATRGAAIVPSAIASPSASSTSPPTSSMERAGTPRRGNTCGRIAVRKKTCVRHPSTSTHTVAISRSDAVPARCALAARPRPAGTPHATSHATSPSITEEKRKDRRNPRRAA